MDDLIRRGDAVRVAESFYRHHCSDAPPTLLLDINALPAATPEPPAEPKKLDAHAALLFMAEAFDGADELGQALLGKFRTRYLCNAADYLQRKGRLVNGARRSIRGAIWNALAGTGSIALFPCTQAGARQRAAWCREQAAKLEADPPAPVPPVTVKCKGCGNLLPNLRPSDNAFCMECGTDNEIPAPAIHPAAEAGVTVTREWLSEAASVLTHCQVHWFACITNQTDPNVNGLWKAMGEWAARLAAEAIAAAGKAGDGK